MTATPTTRSIPYQKLEKDAIRLLRLHPRPASSTFWTHQLRCDLEHVSLEAVRDGTVSFRALSYEWKSLLCAQRMFIRTCTVARQQQQWFPIQVRDNLYRALWEIASTPNWPCSGALIWVDAVCINQSDEDEKSDQVKRMGSLYSLAESVIVWLGVADSKSDDGFAYFAKVRAPLSRKWKDEVASPTDSGWQGVIELHNRSYWKRLWIIQEFANANNIEIRCGSHRTAWKDWMYATKVLTEALSRVPYGTQTVIETSSARMIQIIKETDRRNRTLEYVLNVSFEAECSNPVDRIYGIIGMVNTDPLAEPVDPYIYRSPIYERPAYNPDSHYQLPRAPEDVYSTPELAIDYNKSVWDVYADIMHYHSDYPYPENRLAKTGNPQRTMRLSYLVQHALAIPTLASPRLPDESATSFSCIRAEGSERDRVYALGPPLTPDLTTSEISTWIKSQGLLSSRTQKKALAGISSQIERLKTSNHLNQVRGVVKRTAPNAHIPPSELIYPMIARGRGKTLAIVPSNTKPGDTLCQFQQTEICVVATHSRLVRPMAVSAYIPLSGDPNIFHTSIQMDDTNKPATLVGRALILRMPSEAPRKISELGSTKTFEFSVPPLNARQSVKMECSLRTLQFLSVSML